MAEHDGHALNPSTAKCVTCALELNPDSLAVLVLAAPGAGIAVQAARLAGVSHVLSIEDAANAAPLAAVQAPQVAAVAAGFSHVLGPSTTFGKDLMPRVAALLDVGQLSDIMHVQPLYLRQELII